MFKKIYWVGLSCVVVAMVAVVFYLALNFFVAPLMKPGLSVFNIVSAEGAKITRATTVRQENSYLCRDVEIVYQGPAPKDMVGLDRQALDKKYPAGAGWTIKYDNGGSVVLTRAVDDFCSLHKDYRHLGICRNVLAVYQGPLGSDQKLLRLEEGKKLDLLPEDIRGSLEMSSNLADLDQGAREKLKSQLEFENESLLNSMLENLDEFIE